MKEILLNIATSYYTWIAVELIVIAVLVFFVRKNKRRKKATKKALEEQITASQYQELDNMLVNRKRNVR